MSDYRHSSPIHISPAPTLYFQVEFPLKTSHPRVCAKTAELYPNLEQNNWGDPSPPLVVKMCPLGVESEKS